MGRLKRRFAASAWIWTSEHDANRYMAFERAAQFGFDGIEIPTFDGHLNSARLNEIMNSLVSTYPRLVPIIIGGGSPGTDLVSEDSSIRENGIEYVKNCVARCSEIGGSLVCGPLYSAVGKMSYLSDTEREKQYAIVAEAFKEIGRFAQDSGVMIALEPLCRYDTYLVNTAEQARKLVDMISQENVGLLLDTFHLNIEEKSISEAIKTAGDKLFHFHASENDRGTPGSGQIRWDEVANSLDSLGYEKWIAIESFTPFDKNFSPAMRVWRKLAKDQDEIAVKGLEFLKSKLAS